MWFTMTVEPSQIPPDINESYRPFGFYKFGLGCWCYNVNGREMDGEIEWINTLRFCSRPKYPNPTCFRYRVDSRLKVSISMEPLVRTDIADTVVAGIATNWALAKGLAALAAL